MITKIIGTPNTNKKRKRHTLLGMLGTVLPTIKANPTAIAQLAIIATKRGSIAFGLNIRLHGPVPVQVLLVSEWKLDKRWEIANILPLRGALSVTASFRQVRKLLT